MDITRKKTVENMDYEEVMKWMIVKATLLPKRRDED